MEHPSTDEHLLASALALDEAAIRRLHTDFYNLVAGYIRLKIKDRATVEDLSSEVFTRALESLSQGRGWQKTPKGWLLGIAHHLVVDHYRRQERQQEVSLVEDHLISDDSADPHQQAALNDQLRHMRAAIETLTPEQRDVILMRFIQGVDIQSVAEAIEKTPGAVKALQHRALKALARILHTPTQVPMQPETRHDLET